MRYATVPIATAADMSADIASDGQDLNQVYTYSIQAVYTGAPVGTLQLEISNDNPYIPSSGNPAVNVVNWIPYSGSTVAVSGAGSFMWNVLTTGNRWVRVTYTATSGTGSLDLRYSGKGT